jgi:hypothetical protein
VIQVASSSCRTVFLVQGKAVAMKQTVRRLIRRGIARSLAWLADEPADTTEPGQKTDLQMVWPRARLAHPPTLDVPEGYTLRTYQPGEESVFFNLMERVGFPGWTMPIFDTWLQKTLQDGLFFVVCRETGALAATAMACHNPTPLHMRGR